MRVYIGYDESEHKAYVVARDTALQFGCDVSPIYEQRLRNAGLLTRPVDRRGKRYDLNSDAPQSTDFAISRFFVPLLESSGWCLFTDCDMVFLSDPAQIMEHADPSKAVMVVKHKHESGDDTKMVGQKQTWYQRKNWSSVVLWNCDHPAHQRLNLMALNQWPGRDLHAFKWLADDEIGELPRRWNWLVGVQPKPKDVAIAHFTLGGPFIPGWDGGEYDKIWLEAAAGM